MKKTKMIILTVLSIFLLAACEEEEIDVIDNLIENNLRNTDSFSFDHRYDYSISSTIDGSLYEFDYAIDENVEYVKNGYSHVTTNRTKEEFANGVSSEDKLGSELYSNLINGDAYFSKGSDFYYIPLNKLNSFQLLSTDPIFLLNELISNNSSYYFKFGDTSVAADSSLYDKMVVTISKDVFQKILYNDYKEILDNPYEYEVTAEISFDEDYRITNVTFDFDDFLDKYNSFLEFERGNTVHTLDLSYNIEVSNYNMVNTTTPSSFTDLYADKSDLTISEFIDYEDEFKFGDIKSTVVYDFEKKKYDSSSLITLTNDMDYIYFEMFYYAGSNLVKYSEFEYFDRKKGEELLIDFYSSDEVIDELFLKVSYNQDTFSSFSEETIKIKSDYFGPNNTVELKAENFNQTSNEILESIFIYEKDGKLNLDFSLYFLDTSRDLDYTLYLNNGKNDILTLYVNNQNFEENETYLLSRELDFMPTTAYLFLEYNVSTTQRVQKYVTVNINSHSNSESFKNFELNSTRAKISYDTTYNPSFMNNIFHLKLTTDSFISDYQGMIYFLKDSKIVDKQLISGDGNSVDTYDKSIYVSQVNEIYLVLNTKQGIGIKTATIGIRAIQDIN